MQAQGHHADGLGELDDLVVVRLPGAGVAHDLAGVVAPDLVGEVEGQVLLGTAGGLGEGAGKHGGGVGGDDGPLGEVLGELLVEGDLLCRVLGDGLDHQVGVCGLVVAGGELEAGVGALDLLLEGVDAGVVGTLRPEAACPGRWVGLRGLKGLQVDGAQALELGLGSSDGGVASQPDGDVEAPKRALERDLAAEHATARNGYLLEVHGPIPSRRDALRPDGRRAPFRIRTLVRGVFPYFPWAIGGCDKFQAMGQGGASTGSRWVQGEGHRRSGWGSVT